MLAYKFLTADGRAPITGFRWPLGRWVEASEPLEPCRSGVHACRVADLPHWINAELWLLELGDDVRDAPNSLLAGRGRLVRRIAAWAEGGAREFAEECAARARELTAETPAVAGRAADATANAKAGWASAAAYIAAVVAGEVASGSRRGPLYEQHFLAERARQATWFQRRLGLADE